MKPYRLSRRSRFIAAFAVPLLLSAAIRSAGAEDKPAGPGTPEPYAPGLGDFMTAYVQPHHIKLWLAGKAANWKVAEYEANELRETFEDVTAYQAVWHDFPIAKMVKATLLPNLTPVDKAIKAHDTDQFKAAYEKLTGACNTCHKAAHHEFLAIKVPTESDFPDQEFQPQ